MRSSEGTGKLGQQPVAPVARDTTVQLHHRGGGEIMTEETLRARGVGEEKGKRNKGGGERQDVNIKLIQLTSDSHGGGVNTNTHLK